jgi:hypothetical protein
MAAPRVFFSYAGDDKFWVDLFRRYFVDVLQDVSIFDYRADAVGYGPLSDALDEEIEGSAVVVAFVTKDYQQKEWTVAEWEKSLTEVQRRRLIFVPIMLDADGKEWWQALRRKTRLTALTRDYQYEDFTVGGEPALPGPDAPAIIQKINKLARRIRQDIAAPEQVRLVEPDPPVKPAPPIRPEDQVQSKQEAPLIQDPVLVTPDQVKVVVLGHPAASFPSELEGDKQQLMTALGATAVAWANEWRTQDAARTSIPPQADPVFVQPITVGDSVDYVDDRTRANKHLDGVQRPKARVAIWLPARYKNATFQEAAKQSIAPTNAAKGGKQDYPAFRMDTPEGLAEWLRAEIESVLPTVDRTELQIEGIGADEDTKPATARAAKLLVDQLKDAIFGIVTRAVQKPPPTHATEFWETQFAKQIRIIKGSRAIVAIHDLNIPPHPDERVVRKKVESKFEWIQTAVEAEQQKRTEDGKPSLKLFWTALLVNNAEMLPYANYPDDGRFKDWRLLGFAPVNEEGAAVPDPASLAIFRTNLLAWAAEP